MQSLYERAFTGAVNLVQRHIVPLGVRRRMAWRERNIPPPTPEFRARLEQLGIDVNAIWFGPMTLAPTRLQYIVSELEARRPRRVLEVGSGSSTPVIAALAKLYGFEFYSLENFAGSAEYVEGLLQRMDLERYVRLIVCGFRRRYYPDGRAYWWYDLDVASFGGSIDMVLIDGPMGTLVGRNGTVPEVRAYLSPDCLILLDDAIRSHEKNCVSEWQSYFGGLICATSPTAPEMARLHFAPTLAAN